MYQPRIHKEGDEPDHSQVWKSSWLGPFRVVGKPHHDNSDVYEIEDETSHRKWTVNVHKLRPYTPRSYLKSSDQDELPEATQNVDTTLEATIDAGRSRDASTKTAAPMSTPRDQSQEEPPIVVHQDQTKLPQRRHRSHTRHTTGKTRAELERIKRREKYASQTSGKDLELEALQEYVVEQLLEHRKKGQGYEYLVKWEDYPDEANTWEPTESFGSNLIPVLQYWQKQPYNEWPRKIKTFAKKNKTSI